MPAKSKQQQKFFGVVRAVQKGEFRGKPSGAATSAAHSMSVAEVRKFAKTKRKGLKTRVGRKKGRMSDTGMVFA